MISLNKVDQKGNKRVFAASADDAKAVPDTSGRKDAGGKEFSARKSSARKSSARKSSARKSSARKIGGKKIAGRKIAGGAEGRNTTVDSAAGRYTDETEQGHRSSKYATENATNRGRYGYMQYIHGFISCVLVLLALIHIPFPEPLAWLPYSIAAVLAAITLKSELSMPVSRILAIATAGMMFFLFALFFLVVPTLKADWYMTQYGWAAVCLILSAFMMIPILSEYSCRLKADCMEARAARRTAFFSVPSHIRPESR